MIVIHLILLIFSIFINANSSPIISYDAIHHPVIGTKGMVSTQESYATQIGVDILKQGGNAVDAAVAVGFALSVTLPQAGSLGGGGFMMVYIASENKTIALDFREKAPSLATKTMFLKPDGSVDHQKSRFSIQSVGVPGSVHGLTTALKQYGSLPLAAVINPAIKLAQNGITVSNALHQSLASATQRLTPHPYTRSLFYTKNNPDTRTPDNTTAAPTTNTPQPFIPLAIGSTLIQSDLAKTLTQIKYQGSNAFYNGPISKKIDSFMANTNGLITSTDLKIYQTIQRKPIQSDYRGHTVLSMPPPSSGGIILSQILELIEPFPIQKWGQNSSKTIHMMSQAMSLAYADRAEWLGDEDMVDVPKKALLSSSYINERRTRINPNRHTPSRHVSHGIPKESNQTTHYSVIDQWGNAVSATITLNFSFGSGIAIPGTGILLNNQMDDFSAKPGEPNAYGLIGNHRNAIAPNKRMLSSMSPTIVLNNNSVFLVTGSPGGSRIITTVVQIISNVIDHNMSIAEATHAPRFHFQWLPDELRLEQYGFSADTTHALQKYGYKLVTKSAMGSTQSIMKINGRLYGASDPRKPGALTLGF